MRIYFVIFLLLAGCASTEVIPLAHDKYMLIRQAGTGFQDSGGLRIDGIKDAHKYCAKQNKGLQVTNTHQTPGGPGTYTTAEVEFKCE